MAGQNLLAIAQDYMNNALFARVINEQTHTPRVSTALAAQANPGWNGRLLMNSAGTVWVVIDGVARGYTNEPLFSRVHGWRRQIEVCAPTHHGAGHRCTAVWTNTVFFHIDDISVIQEGPVMSQDATIISNPSGTMFLFENNTVRGIPSADVMNKYQFNWQTGQGNVYADEAIMHIRSLGVVQ